MQCCVWCRYWGNATEESRLNDALLPLWRAQSAFFPSVYLPYGTREGGCTGSGCADLKQQTAWVDGGVTESIRVAALASSGSGGDGVARPTLPYAWYRYHDGEPKGLQLLNATDAQLEFARPYAVGGKSVPHVIIWGSERNASDAQELGRWFGRHADIFGEPRAKKIVAEEGDVAIVDTSTPRAALGRAAAAPASRTSSPAVVFPRDGRVPPYTSCGL